MRIVKDSSDWRSMEGDNELEKRINSYLTFTYIFERDVPADECLEDARKILKIIAESKV